MKFQHTTSFSVAPGIQRITTEASSGASMIVIPGRDATYTVTVQQLMVSWTNLTSAGQVNISAIPGDPDPWIVYQNVPGNQLIVPYFDIQYTLGTYGLRAANNAVGGSYSVTAWYTQILP